jgi:hypothetical protein
MAPRTRGRLSQIQFSNSPAHARAINLAAENPRELSPVFGFRSSKERFLFRVPRKRGSRAPQGAPGMPALLKAGDQPCDRPASPCGAPRRRLTNLGAPLPFGPGLAAFATPGGFKERALDAVVRLEAPPRPPGIMVASHDRRRRSPSTLSTPAEHPSGGRGCGRYSLIKNICQY